MTQEINHHSIDKSTWGPGPWQDEPDRKEWRDNATGFACLAVRHESLGHWCGYVGVEASHPAFGKDYDDVHAEAHGGLTFAGACHGAICHTPREGEGEVWWLGFDCAHWNDFSPGLQATLKSLGSTLPSHGVYKPLEYVEGECRDLALQLQEMKDGE